MTTKPKIYLFLVHQETGQRYPVGEEVVIGRSSGDVMFNDDPKLSSQHCRIYRDPKGLVIHDLNSANGTFLDGRKLEQNKIYLLKAGNSLSVGQQWFKLQAPTSATRKPARKSKKKKRAKKSGFDFVTFLSLVLLVAAAYLLAPHVTKFTAKTDEKPVAILSPFDMVEKEMKAAFKEYNELGRAHGAGELSDKGLSNGIRKFLIPRLNASYEKLGVLKPQTEYEKRKIEINRRLIPALISQVNAMASYAETKSPKLAAEVERLSGVAAEINEEARKLEGPRAPAYSDY